MTDEPEECPLLVEELDPVPLDERLAVEPLEDELERVEVEGEALVVVKLFGTGFADAVAVGFSVVAVGLSVVDGVAAAVAESVPEEDGAIAIASTPAPATASAPPPREIPLRR